MVILSYLRLCVKRFQEPQRSIFKKISQRKREFNADSVFGKDFTAALQNDVDTIEHYAVAINEEYSNAHDAFQDFMLGASTQAQKFVKDNKAAFQSAAEWFRMGDKFKKQARLERLGESTASSFEGAVNAIRLYNEGTEKAGFTLKTDKGEYPVFATTASVGTDGGIYECEAQNVEATVSQSRHCRCMPTTGLLFCVRRALRMPSTYRQR